LRRVESDLVAQVRQRLGAERFDQAFAAGSRLTQQQAVAIVRDHRDPGALSRHGTARKLLLGASWPLRCHSFNAHCPGSPVQKADLDCQHAVGPLDGMPAPQAFAYSVASVNASAAT
jgi:hypothetical protein